MLLMLGLYSLAIKAGAPPVATGVGFGALFALAIAGLWGWQLAAETSQAQRIAKGRQCRRAL